MTQDLTFRPATELLGLMAAKELSPVELLEACLARIEALDGKINAFTHMLTDEARAAAAVECETRIQRGENGPLEGLPLPIKKTWPWSRERRSRWVRECRWSSPS